MSVPHYKNYQRFRVENHRGDSLYCLLCQYVRYGQVKEAREALTKLSRQRGLTAERVRKLLCAAVCTNQGDIIKLILDQSPSLNRQESSQQLSVLWLAILYEYETAAELLVAHGADVNERLGHSPLVDESSTILHCLTLKIEPSAWNEKFIALLVDKGADLTARDSSGQTVLHYAVMMGRVSVVELFLSKGAEVDARDQNGQTPLLAAANTRKADEIVPILIRYGADVAAVSRIGMNVLHCLAYSPEEHVQLAAQLMDMGVPCEARESARWRMPIHMAALKGKAEMVKLYLDRGVKADVIARGGIFPLYEAAKSANPRVLEHLLEGGADLDQKTIRNRTALHSACYNLQIKNIDLLLTAGADILAVDVNKRTAFSLIEYKNLNPCVLLMLKELALRKAREPASQVTDESLLLAYPKLSSYYENCLVEISRARSTKFIESCTFYQLMTKSPANIARLMRNPDFWSKFKGFDLSVFTEYAEHMRKAFQRAEYAYHCAIREGEKINEALNYRLPYLVVERVAFYLQPKYIFNEH